MVLILSPLPTPPLYVSLAGPLLANVTHAREAPLEVQESALQPGKSYFPLVSSPLEILGWRDSKGVSGCRLPVCLMAK